MLPIGDEPLPQRKFSLFTFLLFAANIGVFYLQLTRGQAFIERWALIPNRFLANPIMDLSTLVTALFLHGGWIHLMGNMIFLLVFSGNVETRFGSLKFLIFYLFTGILANVTHMVFSPASGIPIVGASGAIAGILGAYLVMFPKNKIKTIMILFVFKLPAILVIGFWFIIQLFNGIASISETAQTGGIAYMAHVGGFVVGFLLTLFLK